jgi:hypothetical protein
LDQRIATAFNRNGMSTTEAGADPEDYMNKQVTDRVNTTSTVWLGSTIACAECHDHKYDPFTQKEYYELYDFFNQIPEKGLDADPAPPFVEVPDPEQRAALAQIDAEIAQVEAQCNLLQIAAAGQHSSENDLLEIQQLSQRLGELEKTKKDLKAKIPTVRVMQEMDERRPTRIRIRGDYRNQGEQVTAGVPRVLGSLPAGPKPNRLTLAKWLVNPKNPLVARVTVNRYWALCFGAGLVKTGNDFGSQAELPSHPELLDWLAREFIDNGWNIKALQKKIVMSATYRQSSRTRKELLPRDPANRLLARGARFRLPAEMIRDGVLVYSGLYDRTLGGPSVRPYQPAGLWEEIMYEGTEKYEVGKGVDLYRRSLYTLWKRSLLYPMFKTFDAPDRTVATEQRSITCTPLQAFVTMNEETFVEAARVFAQRIMQEGGDSLPSRFAYAYKVALTRPPTVEEQKVLSDIYEEMLNNYQQDPKLADELIGIGEFRRPQQVNEIQLAAWTTVAHVILNLNETLTKK